MMKKLDITILYVEDEPVVRNSIARSLATVCDNVMTAENGVDALEQLKSVPCDLIITDIRMPQMDGLEFVEKLRDEGVEIPVIITSAFNDVEYFQKAIDLKVEKFINKPVRVGDLLDLVIRLGDSISATRSLISRQQELEHYRKAIDTTNFVIRINTKGELLSINTDLYAFLNDTTKSGSESIDIETLFIPGIYDELLQQTQELNIFNKTTLLHFLGRSYTVQITAFASVMHHDLVREITIILNNISPIIQEKDAMIQDLLTDHLTGLPNRQKLFADLRQSESGKGIIIIDIERFSNINYLYGFEMGDQILKEVAHILLNYWPDERPRTVYRSETDHFVIVTEKMEHFDRDKVSTLIHSLIDKIESHNFSFNNVSLDIGVTVGGSCMGENDIYTEALIALSVAKEEHKPFLCYVDLADVKERFNVNIKMQSTIKKALDNDLIVNYYQPIVNTQQQTVKYEALIRMINPYDATQIFAPFHFLDIAKQSKNYSLLTKRVISNAFRDFGEGEYNISINLSFDDIANPEILTFLESNLIRYPNAKITLELLESEGLKDLNKTINFCKRMKEYGISIAIDDFGSGYSNFANLFDIPVDVLKIDGQLVRRVDEEKGYAILKSIITFAKEFGLITVAEYVENETAFNKLQSLGIDLYQGYYFSQPKSYEML